MGDENLGISTLRDDERFQKVFWIVERIAWVAMALISLAALAGLFAHGILSDKIVRLPNGALNVEYDHFQRMTVQSRFVIHIQPQPTEGQDIRLRLNPVFQQAYDIQSLQPQPARSSASAEGLDLFFHPPDQGELVVVIWATPQRFGHIELRAQTNNGGALDFPVFIYP